MPAIPGLMGPVARELVHDRRDRTPIALATVDIDYFKQINDEWGHLVGDRVLAHLAEVLSNQARGIDVAGSAPGSSRRSSHPIWRRCWKADRALHAAKRGGRDRTVVLDRQALRLAA